MIEKKYNPHPGNNPIRAFGYGCLGLIVSGFVGLILLPIPACSCGGGRAEAITTIGSILRTQEAYYLDKATFAPSLAELALEIGEETKRYKYKIEAETDRAMVLAIPRREGLRSHTGVVFAINDENGENTIVTIMCESKLPVSAPPAPPNSPEMVCPEGSKSVSH